MSAAETMSASDETRIVPIECSVFFRYLRLRCQLPSDMERPVSVMLLRDGREVPPEQHDGRVSRPSPVAPLEFTLDGLIDRAAFPDAYAVRIGLRAGALLVPVRDLVERERELHARSLLPEFRERLRHWLDEHPGQRPSLLDIGGRARSGYRHTADFTQCDVTIVDIVADESVDVVADVHRMSEALGRDRFDFAICVSVFEHLIMPWKAAVEINRVLKPDGLLLLQTHQTVGLHDVPWDYYRFSDSCWAGLFGAATGFAVERTAMSSFQRIVPLHYYAVFEGFEGAGGFNESSVLARKTGPATADWPGDAGDLVGTSYPG